MKFTALSSAVLLATLAHAQNQPDPYINTPNAVTQCAVTALTFGGTHPPWVISAIPGGQPGSSPIEDIVTTSVSPYSWLCNLAQGTYITLQIRDSTGQLQYSSPVSVLNSSNSSCVGQGGGVTVTNSATQPLTTSTPSSSGGTSNTRAGTTSKPTGTGTTTSPGTSPTTSKNAASQIQAQIGLAFFLSLIGIVAMV